MARTDIERSQRPRVGFVGGCIPRPCGIATFTYDLATAVTRISDKDQRHVIAAVNDRPQGYEYPALVRVEINQNDAYDYALAAEYLNEFCSVVSLQHEFGIFGPRWGANVLHLLQWLRRPLVVTCHTVPVDPDPEQRDVLSEIVARADRVVVMNRRAVDFLQALYGARYRQIAYIQHGVHEVPFVEAPAKKTRFGVAGPVLLTFGLLHREKGLEYMIEAMAEVVREHPDATYVIVGATHPRWVEVEGEAYRRSLQGKVRRLGLRGRVRFIDGFCDLSDLIAYLAETDIFVAPYLDASRMTSGALSYAAGAGKAVVATPFLHALELLADGRGRLVPSRSAQALSKTVLDLMADERGTSAMRRRIYTYTRRMVWRSVAREYHRLFDAVGARPLKLAPAVQPLVAQKRRPAVTSGPSK
jgi:glycosyltransferase involved in cell wall biosynthesis